MGNFFTSPTELIETSHRGTTQALQTLTSDVDSVQAIPTHSMPEVKMPDVAGAFDAMPEFNTSIPIPKIDPADFNRGFKPGTNVTDPIDDIPISVGPAPPSGFPDRPKFSKRDKFLQLDDEFAPV